MTVESERTTDCENLDCLFNCIMQFVCLVSNRFSDDVCVDDYYCMRSRRGLGQVRISKIKVDVFTLHI